MEKRFILLIMLLVGVSVYSQSDRAFYYYGGKKHFFNTDSTSAVVVMKTDVGSEKLKQQAFDVQSERQAGNRKAYKIRAKSTLDRKALKKELGAEKVYPVFVKDGKEIATLTETFIVCLKEHTTQESFDKLLKKTGTYIDHKYQYGKNVYFIAAKDTTQATSLDLANVFYETGLFKYSEPNFQLMNVLQYDVYDPYYTWQWALRSSSLNGIDAMNAWDLDPQKNGSGIKVAIVDTGVDDTGVQSDLYGQLETERAFLDRDFSSYHGTACAGIIAAKANQIGVTEIAHKCRIIPIVSINGNYTTAETVANGINYAWKDADADVINCSFGSDIDFELISNAVDSATCYGRNGLGCVVVASTGNDGIPYLLYPAKKENVIAVGACNESGSRAIFNSTLNQSSQYGDGIDLVAPGLNVLTTDKYGTGGMDDFSQSYNYGYFSGTSAAAPHVCGVAALLLSSDPTLKYTDVRRAIESNTDKVGSYSYVTTSAQPNGTWNNEMGHGRLNAYKALKSIKNKPSVTLSLSTTDPITYSSTLFFSVKATGIPTGATCEWSVNPKTLTKLSATSDSILLRFGSAGNASLKDTVWFKMNYNGINYIYYKSFSITPMDISTTRVASNQVWSGYRKIPFDDGTMISIASGKKLTINGVIVCQDYSGFEVEVGAELILKPTAKIVCPTNEYGQEFSWGGIMVDIDNTQPFPNNVGIIQRWAGSEIPEYSINFNSSDSPNSVYYSDIEPIESRQVFWKYRIEDTVVWNKNKIIPASGISIAPFGCLTMKDSTFYMGSNAIINIEGYPYNGSLDGYSLGGSLKLQNCSIKAINPTWKWGGIIMNGEDGNLVKSLRMQSLPNKPQNYISDAKNAIKIIGADSLCRWDVVRIEDTRFENCTNVLDISRFYILKSLADSQFRMYNCDILSKFNCINLDHVYNFIFTNNRIEAAQESYSQVMIKANHCTDLLLYGNSFNLNNSNMSATGINLINCSSEISGNLFHKLQIGIALADTVTTDKNILIKDNEFRNDFYGLQGSYIHGLNIKDNFLYSDIQNSVGAMISNCSKYDIDGNYFIEQSSDPVATANIKGLYITSSSNSYYPRIVRNNNFDGLYIGAECNGYNRSTNGTKFRCNNFTSNTTALKVTYIGSSGSGQGLFNQDSITYPAGNTFLNNTSNINNYATSFYYYYRNLANENPSATSTNITCTLTTGTPRCDESYVSYGSTSSLSLLSSDNLQKASVSDLQNTDYLLSTAELLVDKRDFNDAYSFIAQSESLDSNEESADRNGRWREMLDLKMSLARNNAKKLTTEQTSILESLAKENRFDRAGSWASNLLTVSKDTVELIPVYPFDPNLLEQSIGAADTINHWLKISPNPGFATISIQIAEDVYKIEGKKILTISDLAGNVLWSSILKEEERFLFPDKTFAPGSYTCTLSGSNGVISSTIAIVK